MATLPETSSERPGRYVASEIGDPGTRCSCHSQMANGCVEALEEGGRRAASELRREILRMFAGRSLRSVNVDLPYDAVERQQLCDLLDELGPRAPTLLDPWTTHDLAAHLVLREHDLLAAPGLVVPGAWGRFAERRRVGLTETRFTDLVATIRSGPPHGFFRIEWVRRVAKPQRVLRPPRGRAPRKRLRTPHQPSRRRRRALPQCRPYALVPIAPATRRRARPRVGRNGQGHQSTEGATNRSPERASRRVAPVSFRATDAADVEICGSSEAIEALQRTSFGM